MADCTRRAKTTAVLMLNLFQHLPPEFIRNKYPQNLWKIIKKKSKKIWIIRKKVVFLQRKGQKEWFLYSL